MKQPIVLLALVPILVHLQCLATVLGDMQSGPSSVDEFPTLYDEFTDPDFQRTRSTLVSFNIHYYHAGTRDNGWLTQVPKNVTATDDLSMTQAKSFADFPLIWKYLLNSPTLWSFTRKYDTHQRLNRELEKIESPHTRHRRQANVSSPNAMRDELTRNTTTGEMESENSEMKIWNRGILGIAETRFILNILQMVSTIIGFLSTGSAILSVIVFWDKRMTSRLVSLITAFNVTEGGKVLFFSIHRIWRISQRNSTITWASAYAVYFINVIIWFPDGLGRISLLINLIITVDRFVILAFPLRSINRKIVVYPKLTIAAVTVAMFLYQLSNLILFRTEVVHKVNYTRQFMMNQLVAEIAMVSPYSMYIYRIMHVVASICFRYIPLIITITLNIMTIVSLMHQGKPFLQSQKEDSNTKTNQDATLTISQARKRQNNVMIVWSTLIFSVLVSAKPLIRVISMLHPTFGEGKVDLNLYSVVNELGLLLDILSPTITFLSYCKLSSAFRRVLYRMFIKRNSNPSPNESQTISRAT